MKYEFPISAALEPLRGGTSEKIAFPCLLDGMA